MLVVFKPFFVASTPLAAIKPSIKWKKSVPAFPIFKH